MLMMCHLSLNSYNLTSCLGFIHRWQLIISIAKDHGKKNPQLSRKFHDVLDISYYKKEEMLKNSWIGI